MIGIKEFYKKNKSFGDDYFKKMIEKEKRPQSSSWSEPLIQDKGVASELDDLQLKYMYDLGRMSRPFNEVLKNLNDTTLVQFKGKTQHLSWQDGLVYDRDLCEIVLPDVDQIIVPHILQYKKFNDSLEQQVSDKDQLPHTNNALVNCITTIYSNIYKETEFRGGSGPKTQ